jgi:aspartokinase
MPTLSDYVSDQLTRYPHLLEYMHQGLVNISAVASLIGENSVATFREKPSRAAIGMALRRFLQSHKVEREFHQVHFPRNLEISLRSGIYEVALRRTSKAERLADTIRKEISVTKGDLLSIVEGSYEIVVFASQSIEREILKHLKGHPRTSELRYAGIVTVNWPPVTKDIPGIYARVTQAFARREISIQSFHTIGAEMMIIVKEDMLTSAYEALSSLLRDLAK